jgi:hypothetical protein
VTAVGRNRNIFAPQAGAVGALSTHAVAAAAAGGASEKAVPLTSRRSFARGRFDVNSTCEGCSNENKSSS